MPLIKPAIYAIAPFDAREDYQLAYHAESDFDTYELVITDQSDLTRQFHLQGKKNGSGKILIPKNTLENSQITTEVIGGETVERLSAKRYACVLTIFRALDDATTEQESSLPAFFRCQDTPIVSLFGIPADGRVSTQTLHLGGSYSQLQGDALKTFQFHLYDSSGKLIGGTKLNYHDEIEGNIELLDNKTTYYVKLECVSQAGMSASSPLTPFYTDYSQALMYAAIHFDMDSEHAKLILRTDLTEFTGSGENFTYSKDDFVDLRAEGAYVVFHDRYQIIDESFLIKFWLRDIPEKRPFITLLFVDGELQPTGKQIELCYYDGRFHAFKHACGLVSHYASEPAVYAPGELCFLALRHYNHQIDLYPSRYPVQEVSL